MPLKTPTRSHDQAEAPGGTLDRWSTHDWRDGMNVAELRPLDHLVVRTLNSTYEIVVVTPEHADVVVRGGAFFPTFSRVQVAGSSLGGSLLKVHAIHVGFRLELAIDTRSIVTSAVQAIAIGWPDSVM